MAKKKRKRRTQKKSVAVIGGLIGSLIGGYYRYVQIRGDIAVSYEPGEAIFALLTTMRKDPMGGWLTSHSMTVTDAIKVWGPLGAGLAINRGATMIGLNRMVKINGSWKI